MQLPAGGWFTIYREAIKYFESSDGTRWAAAGLWPITFMTLPGDTTLIEFSGDSTVAKIMGTRNPWPMDTIPGYVGGYRADVKAKQASTAEMNQERDRIDGLLNEVKEELVEAGGAIDDNAFPVIAGKVYANIAWFAMRLEHGLGGLPRIPVWARTFTQAQPNMPKWAEQARPQIEQILKGAPTRTPIREMPPELLRDLRRHSG